MALRFGEGRVLEVGVEFASQRIIASVEVAEGGEPEEDDGEEGHADRTPAHPVEGAFHPTGRAGLDRFAGEEPSEIIRQGFRIGIASGRFLARHFQNHGLQIARQASGAATWGTSALVREVG